MSRNPKGNPKAAVEAFLIATGRGAELKRMQQEGLKRKMFGTAPIVVNDIPFDTGSKPQEQAEPEQVTVPLLCFPLQAWLDGAEMLPRDILTLEKSGHALKSHIRPDGAVFLGLYEVPNGKGTGVVVFGDAATEQKVAIAVSQQYRDDVLAERDARDAGRKAALEQTPLPSSLVLAE